MKIYKITYIDECETRFDVFYHTEVVRETSLVKYVNMLWQEGRITEEAISDFVKKYGHNIQTKEQALELLKNDGYDYLEQELY